VLAALLDERGDRRASGSAKEVVLAQLLCRAGLPDPVREHEVRANGRLVARVDLAYPQWKVAIELDSVRWHTGGAALTRDALRRNRLQSLGWIVVSVTVAVLERDPALAVAQVRDAIASRTDPIVARRARLSRR